jgi:hypothetical protein
VANLVPYDEIQIPSALYKQIFPRVEDHATEADVADAALLEARTFTGKGEVGSRASNATRRMHLRAWLTVRDIRRRLIEA